MTTAKHPILFLAVALCVTCAAPVLYAHDGLPPQLEQLARDLVAQRGAAFVAIRDRALALPQDELDQMIAHMRREDAMLAERVVGWMMEGRRDHADLAVDFDRRFKEELENPSGMISRRTARPTHSFWLPREDREQSDRLAFELVLKWDVPDTIKIRFLRGRWGGGPKVPRHDWQREAALLLLEQEHLEPELLLEVVSAVSFFVYDRPDPPVIEALIDANERLRQPLSDGPGFRSRIIQALKNMGGPDALAAVDEAIERERAWMAREGLVPWNHPDALVKARTEVRDYARAKSAAAREGRELTLNEHLRWQNRVSLAQRRSSGRMLWVTLLEAREALGGEPADVSMRDEMDKVRASSDERFRTPQ